MVRLKTLSYVPDYCLKAIFMALSLTCLTLNVCARELACDVEVNSSAIEGTYKSVFDALQESMSEYMNETKWTDASFSNGERINCRMFLTVKEYSGDRIKGDLQVQLTRPVFNSTYTTTLLNFKDTKVEFDYKEGDPLIFNDNIWSNNLTGILDFYAYLFLALDFDSFSPRGGQPYFEKASAVVQGAQSSGEPGWRMYEDSDNRSSVLNAFTDSNTAAVRDLNYTYHRKGLDEMSSSPEKGRAAITDALSAVGDIYQNAPMSVALILFRDAKLRELVDIYSPAPRQEREKVYQILNSVYPADAPMLDKMRNGVES